jgi:hypothetical protein
MSLTRLRELLNEADMLISQHAIYISKLERAVKNREDFAHRTCHECNFGVKWDSTVVPVKGELPEEVRALVEEIEKFIVSFMRSACK